jgi:methionyl-tRNA formyltransferase
LKVAFLGSPPFATPILAALLASRHRTVAVVTQPERAAGRGRRAAASPVVGLAEDARVPVLRPSSARDSQFKAELAALEPDVLLVASYGEILDEALLAIPRRVPLNVHGSLLPRWRGASPVQAAILAGDTHTGVSIQRVVRALDAGDVLLERETPIGAEETAGVLAARLAELGAEAALEALERVAAGQDHYRPQDPAGVTVCRKLRKADGWIDWSADPAAIERRVRAMQPWPGAWTHSQSGRRFELLDVHAVAEPPPGPPGCLDAEALAAGRLEVAAGAGRLAVKRLKTEGRSAMEVEAFLRGARLDGGDRLLSGAPEVVS